MNGVDVYRVNSKLLYSCSRPPQNFKARFKCRISHVPNLMEMSEKNRFFTFALDSAREIRRLKRALIWSFHVVVLERAAKKKKCTKMQNACTGRAEPLFFLIKFIVFWRSRSRRRRPCFIVSTACCSYVKMPPARKEYSCSREE